MSAATPRRAVILVGGPARPYSRALRISRTLVGEGYAVEIAAITAIGAPDLEREGPVIVRRYVPSGRHARFATVHTAPDAWPRPAAHDGTASAPALAPTTPSTTAATTATAAAKRRPLPLRVLGKARSVGRRMQRSWRLLRTRVEWPQTVRGWWATLDRELAPADLYHACGVLAIMPALRASGRDRRAGRRSVVIYDAVDNTFEGNNVLGMPALLRRMHAARERRWARAADARTTVNEALSARLAARWDVDPPVVIPNWPELPATAISGSDRIRETLGLSPEMRIVLFQGRLSPNLGLDEAAEAVLRLDRACLVLLGFGRWMGRCRARDAAPRYAGRHFTLPAVHPDALPGWTASADVSLVTLPPVSVNQRESTPNKFWESLLVGTPVVVGPGLDLMARIVRDAGGGVVASSLEPEALAAAIRTALDVEPVERAERRRRLAAIAAERYTWSHAAARYRDVLQGLMGVRS